MLETLAQKGFFLTTTIGDLNAKSCNWYSHDKTSFEGSTIEGTTSQFAPGVKPWGIFFIVNYGFIN